MGPTTSTEHKGHRPVTHGDVGPAAPVPCPYSPTVTLQNHVREIGSTLACTPHRPNFTSTFYFVVNFLENHHIGTQIQRIIFTTDDTYVEAFTHLRPKFHVNLYWDLHSPHPNSTIVLGSVAIRGNDLNTLSISSTLKNSNKQLIRTSGMFGYCLSNLNIGKAIKWVIVNYHIQMKNNNKYFDDVIN